MTKWKQVGVIGVDAGLCWIGDPCYLKSGELPWEDWHKFCDKIYDLENGKDQGVTQFNYELGHPGLGVLTTTGYGDGIYPVYAKFKDSRVVQIKIDFEHEAG